MAELNSNKTGETPLITELPWMIVFSSEALLILMRNSTTVVTFLKIRTHLRRTCYLLLNLTFADLLLGVAILLYTWEGFLFMSRNHGTQNFLVGNSGLTIDILASTASVSSLALISLERLFAILWPFRNRMLETWHYIVSVSVLWVLSIINAVVVLVLSSKGTKSFATIGFFATSIFSLTVTVASYLAIWMATRRNRMQNITYRSQSKNKKLARTLCIVTLLSLITWLPAGITLAIPNYFANFKSPYSEIIVALQYANSFLNPMIYCFRMPQFKSAVKQLCCRHRYRWKTRPSSADIPAWVTDGISLTTTQRTAVENNS